MKYKAYLFVCCSFFSISAMDVEGRILGTEFHGRDLCCLSVDQLGSLKRLLLQHLAHIQISLVDCHFAEGSFKEDRKKLEFSLSRVQDMLERKRLRRHFERIPTLRQLLGFK